MEAVFWAFQWFSSIPRHHVSGRDCGLPATFHAHRHWREFRVDICMVDGFCNLWDMWMNLFERRVRAPGYILHRRRFLLAFASAGLPGLKLELKGAFFPSHCAGSYELA
ncbi:hypothetical protein BDW02DRAFT_76568 [Decorospora gaudefroyi]|uniref:Uncharacterized protein n=1 Tax=Decorospora gaudefroyi TaxID=184978 RepID=A0A6A5K4E5_9PLEO|nr:hypothetical protein BDW02DRAFT_76568 [Decorospora gaudefroyi]